VTNHMVSAGNGAVKPALGESWKSVPHVRLMISREHSSNICTGTVLKHTLLVFPLAIQLYFYLSLQQQ
jgi:RAD51-like protein 3